VDCGGPKKACIRRESREPSCEWAVLKGKAAACCEVWGLSAEAVVWDVGLGESKEARIRWGCTLAPHGEYD